MHRKTRWYWGVMLAAALAAIMVLAVVPGYTQGSGEKLYQTKCASCHAADGSGNTPAGKATKARPFCSEEVQKETDAEWTEIIVKGKNKMPSYDKKLSEAEIKDVVAYIRGLCKK